MKIFGFMFAIRSGRIVIGRIHSGASPEFGRSIRETGMEIIFISPRIF